MKVNKTFKPLYAGYLSYDQKKIKLAIYRCNFSRKIYTTACKNRLINIRLDKQQAEAQALAHIEEQLSQSVHDRDIRINRRMGNQIVPDIDD